MASLIHFNLHTFSILLLFLHFCFTLRVLLCLTVFENFMKIDKERQSKKKRSMLCLANWNGPFYKSVYPIQSLRLSPSEGKKKDD